MFTNFGGEFDFLNEFIVRLIGGAAIVKSSPFVFFTPTRLNPACLERASTEFIEPKELCQLQ